LIDKTYRKTCLVRGVTALAVHWLKKTTTDDEESTLFHFRCIFKQFIVIIIHRDLHRDLHQHFLLSNIMAPFNKFFSGSSDQNASTSSSSSSASTTAGSALPPSPFFQPSTPFQVKVIHTPGGSEHKQRVPRGDKSVDDEHKSTILGCAANLINAIVGSGIVGIPYAIQQAGFCTGLVLVMLCALLTGMYI
jgi:hypothetical protein